jgi:hypothetical protein
MPGRKTAVDPARRATRLSSRDELAERQEGSRDDVG